MVEAWLDRNSAIGAWQYSIPPDASPATIDWDRFLGSAPKRPFEPIRMFRWRNYRDYGTGVAGDLFVHLLTGLHFATGAKGPTRVYATGGLRFWNDGRDVPDVMLALLDYPGFTVQLKVNFESGTPDESFGVKFIGSEGTMTTGFDELKLSRTPRASEPGYTIDTFPEAVQKKFLDGYRKQYPITHAERRQPASQQGRRLHAARGFRCTPGTSPRFLRSRTGSQAVGGGCSVRPARRRSSFTDERQLLRKAGLQLGSGEARFVAGATISAQTESRKHS